MKRIHVQLSVQDLTASIRFYSALFGAPPLDASEAQAAWWLEEPRLSFAISAGADTPGSGHLDHLAIVAGSPLEHHVATQGLQLAGQSIRGHAVSPCCGASDEAASVRDPQNILWRSALSYGSPASQPANASPVSGARNACCPSA